jgi:hypothetical protein
MKIIYLFFLASKILSLLLLLKFVIMAQTAGITIERNANGVPSFVRIDIKRYGDQLKDFFSSNGIKVEESPYDTKFISKIKQSQKEYENGECEVVKLESFWDR